MPDENPPVGAVVPAVPAVVVTPPAVATVQSAPVVPVVSPVTAPAAPADLDPAWLGERIARAKASAQQELLKQLGVNDAAAAKTAVDAAKAAEEAKKTAEQRAAELSASLTSSKSEGEKQAALIKEHAGRMLMALSAPQQKAITDFAGDNPAEQLRAIHSFAPMWAAAETEAQRVAAEAAAKAAPVVPPVAKLADTAPPGTPPASQSPNSPPDHKSVYQTTRTANPFAAAAYGLKNPAVYETKT